MIPLLLAPATWAEPPGEADVEVVVEAGAPVRSASSRTLDRDAVEALPARSTDEILRAMPGLHLSSHGGHGKAYQYFLRGFDAVHGADLAVEIGGVPINDRSNVHANGYLDLHFVPAALVQSVELTPGAWRADLGSYAVAGAASFGLGLDREGGLLTVGGGTDRSGEVGLAWRPRGTGSGNFLVAEASLGAGVGEARGWRQLRAGAGVQGELGPARGRAWVLAYDGRFESPGVLREDDLAAGRVGFYDAYPGSGGGHSARLLAAAELFGGDERLLWKVSSWAGLRSLDLQQNFTGWYDEPQHGDGSEQTYGARSAGVRGRVGWTAHRTVSLHGGVDGRVDDVTQSDRGITVTGQPWEDGTSLTGWQSELGSWATVTWRPVRGLRVEPGLRAESLLLHREDLQTAWAPVLAPKLTVVLAEQGRTTGFLSYGRGFRTPDLRGVADGGRAPVALADSLEMGGTLSPNDQLAFRLAAFGTRVSDEIVFDHVAARYLLTGTTRRLGVDGGAVFRPLHGLRLQADLTWSDGRYTRTGEPIPYAPRLLVSTGLYAEGLELAVGELTGGLRVWALGPRPLPGGFASPAALVGDLTVSLRRERWQGGLEVDNVLGNRWRDGAFVYASRWDPSASRSELPVRHFTAGLPTALRLTASRRF